MQRAAAGLLAVTIAGLTAACGILVPSTLSEVRCTDEGAIGPPACPDGTFCLKGVCQAGPPAIGEPCGEGGVCGPDDRCIDPSTLGLEGSSFCGRPCCSSADCGDDTGAVCAILGPGKLCVPGSMWHRGATGDRFGGEPCAADADCRSGECSTKEHICVDACCSDVDCTLFGAACRSDVEGWVCAPQKPAQKPALALCEHDDECSSGVCVAWPDSIKRCAEPCCSSVECGKLKVGDMVRNVLCVPVQHNDSLLLACAAAATTDAQRMVGEPCDVPAQCRGGRCIVDPTRPKAGKICSDVCCTDSSCGAPHLFACLPAQPDAQPGSEGQGFDLQCTTR